MIKFFKVFVFTILFLTLLLVAFYFWASSPNHEKDEYLQLIENQFPNSTENDSIYSIITYNIGYLSGMTNNLPVSKNKELFDNNLINVYNQFDLLNPDIICFQEIDYHSNRSYYVNQQEELQKLGYNYIFQAVNWDVNYLPFPYYPPSTHFGEVLSGQSILSKYPLKDNERIVLERIEDSPFYRDAFYLNRLAQVTKIIIDDNEVIVINVHLEAFDVVTRTKQTKYIAGLFNKYKDSYPVLLVGDFNSDLDFDNASIQMILDIQGIASARLDSQNKEKTFPSDHPSERLDYIFYNENYIELIDSRILSSFGQASDHLPVLMEFKLK